MRIIKFRTWKNGEMHEDGESKFWLSQGFDYEYMQFTGLLDRNGTEIYESDIVAWDKANHQFKDIVTYRDASFRLDNFFMSSFDEVNDAFGEGIGMLYVIGNIYENPELLPAANTNE